MVFILRFIYLSDSNKVAYLRAQIVPSTETRVRRTKMQIKFIVTFFELSATHPNIIKISSKNRRNPQNDGIGEGLNYLT